MAVEIESFIRAWARVVALGPPATYNYVGEGITSITRTTGGGYAHLLTEEFDVSRVGFEVTPFYDDQQGAGFVAANIDFNATISPTVQVQFAITSTEAVDDPAGWTLLVLAGSAEAELVAVV